MTKDLIRYDLQVQNALKGVVRKVLSDAARDGLPGEHHFYVTFKTRAPGVRLSQHLRDTYPDEMTIVLQHQFWDLGVTEHAFEVGLSFRGIPERLLVPFDAISGFFDPSVQFGLKFDTAETGDAMTVPAPGGETEAPVPVLSAPKLPAKSARGSVPTVPVLAPASKGTKDIGSKDAPPKEPKSKGAKKADKSSGDETQPTAGEPGATVVSLDSFRKK